MPKVHINLPPDWIKAIDDERGDMSRVEFIQNCIISKRYLRARVVRRLSEPPRRGKYKRTKKGGVNDA